MTKNESPLFISENRLSQDTCSKKFFHHCSVLFYCKSGCARLMCGGNTLVIEQGSFTLIAPDTEYTALSCSALTITFGFEYDHATEKMFYATIYMDRDSEILGMLECIQQELSEHLPYSDKCICSCYKIILLLLLRHTTSHVRRSDTDGVSHQLKYVSSYLEQHYSANVDIVSLFETLGYSYNHLRHAFKQHFGCAPKQYLANIRLGAARRLLATSDCSLKAVAEKCGFSSVARLNVYFTKAYGITPTQYRESMNKEGDEPHER